MLKHLCKIDLIDFQKKYKDIRENYLGSTLLPSVSLIVIVHCRCLSSSSSSSWLMFNLVKKEKMKKMKELTFCVVVWVRQEYRGMFHFVGADDPYQR